MSYELRMVPPNWEHPKDKLGAFIPMHDWSFECAVDEWQEELAKWNAVNHRSTFEEFYGEHPERSDYRPWKNADATWFQVWEKVSNGTPITPPFATKEELIEYLVASGDFFTKEMCRMNRGNYRNPWTRQAAELFVMRDGSACTLVIGDNGLPQSGIEALAHEAEDENV